jgi:hypothetical protein
VVRRHREPLEGRYDDEEPPTLAEFSNSDVEMMVGGYGFEPQTLLV